MTSFQFSMLFRKKLNDIEKRKQVFSIPLFKREDIIRKKKNKDELYFN